jgi:hypothetical protein
LVMREKGMIKKRNRKALRADKGWSSPYLKQMLMGNRSDDTAKHEAVPSKLDNLKDDVSLIKVVKQFKK